jgi:hypothetical protein
MGAPPPVKTAKEVSGGIVRGLKKWLDGCGVQWKEFEDLLK